MFVCVSGHVCIVIVGVCVIDCMFANAWACVCVCVGVCMFVNVCACMATVLCLCVSLAMMVW